MCASQMAEVVMLNTLGPYKKCGSFLPLNLPLEPPLISFVGISTYGYNAASIVGLSL